MQASSVYTCIRVYEYTSICVYIIRKNRRGTHTHTHTQRKEGRKEGRGHFLSLSLSLWGEGVPYNSAKAIFVATRKIQSFLLLDRTRSLPTPRTGSRLDPDSLRYPRNSKACTRYMQRDSAFLLLWAHRPGLHQYNIFVSSETAAKRRTGTSELRVSVYKVTGVVVVVKGEKPTETNSDGTTARFRTSKFKSKDKKPTM